MVNKIFFLYFYYSSRRRTATPRCFSSTSGGPTQHPPSSRRQIATPRRSTTTSGDQSDHPSSYRRQTATSRRFTSEGQSDTSFCAATSRAQTATVASVMPDGVSGNLVSLLVVFISSINISYIFGKKPFMQKYFVQHNF